MPSLKRKRDHSTQSNGKINESPDDIFRRHFEAKFGTVDIKPVNHIIKRPSSKYKSSSLEERNSSSLRNSGSRHIDESEESEEEDDDDNEEEEAEQEEDNGWSGIDDTQDNSKPVDPEPEIIEYDFSKRGSAPLVKPSRNEFMSSKPPSTSSISKPSTNKDSDPESHQLELQNLRHDISLQNLLRESHLLDPNTLNSSHTKHANSRLLTLDSRLQALGAVDIKSETAARTMPMNIRKGMIAKQTYREQKRRKDAKEAGVVLERFGGGSGGKRKSNSNTRRSGNGGGIRGGRKAGRNGIDKPAVGKFRRGALVLNRRDVDNMGRR